MALGAMVGALVAVGAEVAVEAEVAAATGAQAARIMTNIVSIPIHATGFSECFEREFFTIFSSKR